jgi:hypothetical protein
LVLGAIAVTFQLVWADRFNFWYVKQQVLAGRSTQEAKNGVWSFPAAIGSTGRSHYEYVDIPEPIVKEEEKTAAEPEQENRTDDDF